jgi:hypothetical protein
VEEGLKTHEVGFNQRIRLEWLERAAALATAGDHTEAKEVLNEAVSSTLSIGSSATRGNKDKAVSILLRIWVRPHTELEPFRDEGLLIFKKLPSSKHLPLHWGMIMATYPFFGAVAENTGRLLHLQGTVSADQVQQRLREVYGERETVFRAVRRTIRCLIDWEVMRDTDKKGVYSANPKRTVDDQELGAFLLEAVLRSTGSATLALEAATIHPSLFPFVLPSLGAADVERLGRLELFRQGLDEDMVVLK